MQPILRSEPSIQIRNLSLSFDLKFFRTESLRDLFVRSVRNPWDTLLRIPDQHVVFEGINLDFYSGDRIGLIGINGAGKSSLCRCLADIYTPTSGSVKRTGSCRVIFDTAIGIHPELTGRENASLLIELLYPKEIHDKEAILNEAIEFSELEEFIDTPYKYYSNGMQARLCLSLISARPADLLILDEVFDGADQFFRKKISERVRKIIDESRTVVFVSHSFDQIKDVCNRVIILHERKIVFDGSPEDAYQFYKKLGS